VKIVGTAQTLSDSIGGLEPGSFDSGVENPTDHATKCDNRENAISALHPPEERGIIELGYKRVKMRVGTAQKE